MIFAVDELLCGRKTKVLVAWLQRNEFQGAGGVGALLSIGENVKFCSCGMGVAGEAPAERTEVELISWSYGHELSANSGSQQ